MTRHFIMGLVGAAFLAVVVVLIVGIGRLYGH